MSASLVPGPRGTPGRSSDERGGPREHGPFTPDGLRTFGCGLPTSWRQICGTATRCTATGRWNSRPRALSGSSLSVGRTRSRKTACARHRRVHGWCPAASACTTRRSGALCAAVGWRALAGAGNRMRLVLEPVLASPAVRRTAVGHHGVHGSTARSRPLGQRVGLDVARISAIVNAAGPGGPCTLRRRGTTPSVPPMNRDGADLSSRTRSKTERES